MSLFSYWILYCIKFVCSKNVTLLPTKILGCTCMASCVFATCVIRSVHRFSITSRVFQIERCLCETIASIEAKLSKNRNHLHVDNHVFQQFELKIYKSNTKPKKGHFVITLRIEFFCSSLYSARPKPLSMVWYKVSNS